MTEFDFWKDSGLPRRTAARAASEEWGRAARIEPSGTINRAIAEAAQREAQRLVGLEREAR